MRRYSSRGGNGARGRAASAVPFGGAPVDLAICRGRPGASHNGTGRAIAGGAHLRGKPVRLPLSDGDTGFGGICHGWEVEAGIGFGWARAVYRAGGLYA